MMKWLGWLGVTSWPSWELAYPPPQKKALLSRWFSELPQVGYVSSLEGKQQASQLVNVCVLLIFYLAWWCIGTPLSLATKNMRGGEKEIDLSTVSRSQSTNEAMRNVQHFLSHTVYYDIIHETGVFTYIWLIFMVPFPRHFWRWFPVSLSSPEGKCIRCRQIYQSHGCVVLCMTVWQSQISWPFKLTAR